MMKRTEKVDAVVVGAGLGGVLTAAILAQRKYRVALLERKNFPGGRYTSIQKDGYKINTGAYAVGLHGRNGPLYTLLTEIGVKVETKVTPPHQIWAGEKRVILPEKGQLNAIMEALSSNKTEAENVLANVRQALRWQEPSDSIMCDQWLSRYTDNPLISAFFDFFARSMTGAYYSELPAGEYFRLMRSFGKFGTSTSMPNGQKSTMDALMQILERWKVDIRLQCKVDSIICVKDQVEGVIADHEGNKLEIETNVVISDVGPKETVALVGESKFDSGFLKDVAEVGETRAVVNVFAYDKPIINSPCHVQLLGWDRLTAAWEANQVWLDYAPPGKQNMIVYSNMKTDDTKRELDLIIDQCKQQFPALEKAEVKATMIFKENWPILRAKPGKCLNIRTPFYGLYLAGDAVNPRGLTCGEGVSFSSRAIAADIEKTFPRHS